MISETATSGTTVRARRTAPYGVVVVVVVVESVVVVAATPTVIVTVDPEGAVTPPAGVWAVTRPTLPLDVLTGVVTTLTSKPLPLSVLVAVASC
jgi:hypothetical protein